MMGPFLIISVTLVMLLGTFRVLGLQKNDWVRILTGCVLFTYSLMALPVLYFEFTRHGFFYGLVFPRCICRVEGKSPSTGDIDRVLKATPGCTELHLDEATEIGDDAARYLAAFRGVVWASSVPSISDTAAKSFANGRAEFSGDGSVERQIIAAGSTPASQSTKDASVAEEAAPEGTLQQGQVAKNSLDLSKPSSGTWAGLFGFNVDPTPDSFRKFVEHEIQSIPNIAPALKPRDSYNFDLKKTNSVVAPYEGVFVVECQSEHGDANVGITCTYTVEANYGLIDGTWTCRSLAVTEGVPIPFNKHLSEPANSPAYRMAEARVRSMSKLISQARSNKPANIIAFQKLADMSRGDWGARLAKVLMLNH
jgi:hypothetical protein